MEGWTDFFVAEVGAAAALAGLLVVAISINIERILKFPSLPGRAWQTLVTIGVALVVASLALMPGQPLSLFGWEALVGGLVVAYTGVREAVRTVAMRKPGDPLGWIVMPLATVGYVCLPDIVGGWLLVAGSGSGLYWVAIGIILAFLATLQNGWVLLIEILR
jgi:modulator of FtsH protease